VAQDNTQKVGAGYPPSKILIDGVPVKGVEELAVSRVLMGTADRMFYAGLDLPVQ